MIIIFFHRLPILRTVHVEITYSIDSARESSWLSLTMGSVGFLAEAEGIPDGISPWRALSKHTMHHSDLALAVFISRTSLETTVMFLSNSTSFLKIKLRRSYFKTEEPHGAGG